MKGHIRKRQNKQGNSWQIVIDVGGSTPATRKRIYQTVAGTKKEAERVMLEILNKLNAGSLIEKSRITVREYIASWLEDFIKPHKAPTTYDDYRRSMNRHTFPALGKIQLQELQPLMVQQFYNHLTVEQCLSASSLRNIHNQLHKALDQAMRMRLIDRNPTDCLELPKIQRRRVQVYDEQEIILLMDKVKDDDLELPVTLAAVLGLRRGEVLGLKWEDVDWENGKLHIRRNLINSTQGYLFHTPKT